MTARTIIAALSAYAFCAVLTFGYAAANETECAAKARDVAKCQATSAAAAGIFWPFYWSWVAFDAEGGDELL
jgi:hypothetical protein